MLGLSVTIKEFKKVSKHNVCLLKIMEINQCAKMQNTTWLNEMLIAFS